MDFKDGQITLFFVIIFIILCCMFTCFYRIYEIVKKKHSADRSSNPANDSPQDHNGSRYAENLRLLQGRSSLVDERRKSNQTNRVSIEDSYLGFKGGRPDIFINDDSNHTMRGSIDTNDKSINSGQGISLLSIDSQRSSRSSSTLLMPCSPRAQTSHSLSLRPSEASILPFCQTGNLTFSINLNKSQNLLSINVIECTDLSTNNIIRRHSATPDYNSKRNLSALMSQQGQPITETYIILLYAPENEEVISYRLEKVKTIDGNSIFNRTINFISSTHEKVFNTSIFFIVRGLIKGNHPSLMNRNNCQLSDHTISIFLGSVDFGKIGYSVSLNDEDIKIQTVPLINSGDNTSLSKQLDCYSNCLPQLMLSVLYNPDEKNITVTIVKAKRLSKPVISDFIPNYISTFVKIQAIVSGVRNNSSRNSLVSDTYNPERSGSSLDVLLKRRTQIRPKTRYPKYNETFSFMLPSRVPMELLPSSLILEAEVFHVNNNNITEASIDNNTAEAISIGRVVLGQQSTISSINSRYWWKIFKNPGKNFNEWHEIT